MPPAAQTEVTRLDMAYIAAVGNLAVVSPTQSLFNVSRKRSKVAFKILFSSFRVEGLFQAIARSLAITFCARACLTDFGSSFFFGGRFSSYRCRIFFASCKSCGLRITSHRNSFRFLVLGQHETLPSDNDKTSLLFTAANKPGALQEMLACFSDNGVSLTRIPTCPYVMAVIQYESN